ncbi:MAG: MBL fold metallo-hydrolase [Aquificota bacterium]|nr:MBL fold metallo-hydrolase [Aquificota bacterium]
MDPGPGAFVYLKELGLDYRSIDLIVLSHIHLDHTADVNTLIEACTDGGRRKDLSLFCPRSAVEGEDRVVLPYLLKRLKCVEYLEEGSDLRCGSLKVRAVMRHTHHGAETYGLSFNDRVVYMTCGRYEERMIDMYPENPELLIINTTFYRKREGIDHLSVEEIKEFLKVKRPERTVITHFSMEMHGRDPEKVALDLSRETGLEVISAKDGMVLDLN